MHGETTLQEKRRPVYSRRHTGRGGSSAVRCESKCCRNSTRRFGVFAISFIYYSGLASSVHFWMSRLASSVHSNPVSSRGNFILVSLRMIVEFDNFDANNIDRYTGVLNPPSTWANN